MGLNSGFHQEEEIDVVHSSIDTIFGLAIMAIRLSIGATSCVDVIEKQSR